MARVARRSGLEWIMLTAWACWTHPMAARFRGGVIAALGLGLLVALASYHVTDPSLNAVSDEPARNLMGGLGAIWADIALQSLGLVAWPAVLFMLLFGLGRAADRDPDANRDGLRLRMLLSLVGMLALAGLLAAPAPPVNWPLARGLGGFWGDAILHGVAILFRFIRLPAPVLISAILLGVGAALAIGAAVGVQKFEPGKLLDTLREGLTLRRATLAPVDEPEVRKARKRRPARDVDAEPIVAEAETPIAPAVKTPKAPVRGSDRELRENQQAFDFVKPGGFQLPELSMLAKPKPRSAAFDEAALRQNARMLESVLAEFGVRGNIDQIRAGPVVTLYELVPAPGVKSARVVALSDDIARSMSVAACRVAVVPGRNAIGVELPNARRETVYLRDMLGSSEFEKSTQMLPLALGETIGGEPYIADLSRMPHLLIAGTTGSGKSVGVNAMILSILYRLPPDQCRFIMIDPKMLELSVYDGIPICWRPWSLIRRKPSWR